MKLLNRIMPSAASLMLAAALGSTHIGAVAAEEAADKQILYPVADFVSDWDVKEMKLSPDGKRMLFVTPLQGNPVLVLGEFVEGKFRPLSQQPFTPDSYPINIQWATNDRLIFTLKQKAKIKRTKYYTWTEVLMSVNFDGSEFQILRTDRKSGEGSLKHLDNADVISLLRDDPDHILVGKSRRGTWVDEYYDGAIDDVYKLNIKTGEMSLYLKGPKIKDFKFNDWYADHKGHIRFGYGYDRKDNSVMIIRGRGDDEWKVLSDNELFEEGKFTPLRFGADDNEFYVLSSFGTGRMAVYRFDIDSGTLGDMVFSHDSVDATGIIYSVDKGKVVAAEYNDGGAKLYYLDEEYGAVRDRIGRALKTGFSLWSTSDDDKAMIVMAGNERDAGSFYFYNVPEAKLDYLSSRLLKLEPSQLAEMDYVSYETRDGLTVNAVMTKPRLNTGEPLPFIIMPHAAPHGRDSIEWDRTAQFFANRGYGVFQPNYRGSSGFGQRFIALGKGEWGRDMQNDLTDGVEWLIDEGHAAEGKICILGRGYAGYAALMAVAKESELYSCAISRDAPVDISKMLKDAGDLDEEDSDYLDVAGDLKKKELDSISPLSLMDGIASPVLIYHREDAYYGVKHTRSFVKALEKAKKRFDYLEIEEEKGENLYDADVDQKRFLELVEAWLLEVNPTPLLQEASKTGLVVAMPKMSESSR